MYHYYLLTTVSLVNKIARKMGTRDIIFPYYKYCFQNACENSETLLFNECLENLEPHEIEEILNEEKSHPYLWYAWSALESALEEGSVGNERG